MGYTLNINRTKFTNLDDTEPRFGITVEQDSWGNYWHWYSDKFLEFVDGKYQAIKLPTDDNELFYLVYSWNTPVRENVTALPDHGVWIDGKHYDESEFLEMIEYAEEKFEEEYH